MPGVSVIIPTYNYGQYLRKAIDSVLSQDGVDVEVIVVDDGSTDDTQEILREYGHRIRAFRQINQGASTARNRGLQEAGGEFVLFLDADDWLMSRALSSRWEFLRGHPDCGGVYGPCYYHNESGKDNSREFLRYPFAYRKRRQGNILGYMLLGELVHTCCMMLRRTLVHEVGGFDAELPVLEDYELWLRVAARSPVGFIQDCNVVVVTHEGSINRSSSDHYRTLVRILRQAEVRYPEVVQSLGYAWQRRLAQALAERGRHLIDEGDVASGRGLLREAIRRDPWHPRHYLGYLKRWFARFVVA